MVHFDCLCGGGSIESNYTLLCCLKWYKTPDYYFCFLADPTPLSLREIRNELSEVAAAKWYQLGVQLGIPPATLSTIESDHPRDAGRCMIGVLSWWLHNAPECSWEKLTEAVEAMGGYRTVVERLRKKTSQG